MLLVLNGDRTFAQDDAQGGGAAICGEGTILINGACQLDPDYDPSSSSSPSSSLSSSSSFKSVRPRMRSDNGSLLLDVPEHKDVLVTCGANPSLALCGEIERMRVSVEEAIPAAVSGARTLIQDLETRVEGQLNGLSGQLNTLSAEVKTVRNSVSNTIDTKLVRVDETATQTRSMLNDLQGRIEKYTNCIDASMVYNAKTGKCEPGRLAQVDTKKNPSCRSDQAGVLVFDPEKKLVTFCDGTKYKAVNEPVAGMSRSAPAPSCLSVLRLTPEVAKDGPFWVNEEDPRYTMCVFNLDAGTAIEAGPVLRELEITGSAKVNEYSAFASNVNKGDTSIALRGVRSGKSHAQAFKENMPVLLVQMQDYNGRDTVGAYEVNFVKSVTGNRVTLLNPTKTAYKSGRFGHPNMAQAAQMIAMAAGSSVKVSPGSTVTADDWNGESGGIVAILAQSLASIGGTIDVRYKGFRGGLMHSGGGHCQSHKSSGFQGESWPGRGRRLGRVLGGCCNSEVNGIAYNGYADNNGGGGGGGAGTCHGGGGGGGGYGTWEGLTKCYKNTGGYKCNHRGDVGFGAPECSRGGFASWRGEEYADKWLTDRFLVGSGGGGGNSYSPSGNDRNMGGDGGGSVFIMSYKDVSVLNGAQILADGEDGYPKRNTGERSSWERRNSQDGSGGSGSGGAIFIRAEAGAADIKGKLSVGGGGCGARSGWGGDNTQNGAQGSWGIVAVHAAKFLSNSVGKQPYAHFGKTGLATSQGPGPLSVEATAGNVIVNRYAAVMSNIAAGGTKIALRKEFTHDYFPAGGYVLVHQVQHSDTSRSGRREWAKIKSFDGSVLTLESGLSRAYDSGAWNSDKGSRVTQVVYAPDAGAVTIGGVVTAPRFNGYTGGVVALRGTSVTVTGTIDVSFKGYRGGRAFPATGGSCKSWLRAGYQGESYTSRGRIGSARVGSNCCSGPVNSGGQSQSPNNKGGGAGGAGACHGGGGGGGAFGGFSGLGRCRPSGARVSGSVGWGAAETTRAGRVVPPGAGYGGSGQHDRLYLGSGGGGGNSYSPHRMEDNRGGAGGGAVYLYSEGDIRITGTIKARGENGWPKAGTNEFDWWQSTNTQDGSGGSGSGGGLYLEALGNIDLATVDMRGGDCNARTGWHDKAQWGARGGYGRIHMAYGGSASGPRSGNNPYVHKRKR